MNTRKDNHGKAMKSWIAMAPGHIAKPLRHIGTRTNARDADGRVLLSTQYIEAHQAAARGDGARVQQMARAVA